MPSWFIPENLIAIALIWLLLEGASLFLRYRRTGRFSWSWWLLAQTLSGAMLLLAALMLASGKGMMAFAVCMAGAFLAHLLEWKLRPDQGER